MTNNRSTELLIAAVKHDMQRILFENNGEQVNLYKIIHELRHSNPEFNDSDIEWNNWPNLILTLSASITPTLPVTSN